MTERPTMDLTVEALRDARFREGWRGYNPADVDEFIDQISVGVQGLHDRIQELTLRAERAEGRTVGESDDTVKRTLVLAQRAADLVVREAKSVSERIVADARHDAERIADEARVDSDNRRHQVNADIDREAFERQAAVEVELRAVQSRVAAEQEVAARERIARQAELDEIHTHAQAARDRLRAALTDHLVRLDRLVDATAAVPVAVLPSVPVLAVSPFAGVAAPPAVALPTALAVAPPVSLEQEVMSVPGASIPWPAVAEAPADDFMS